MIINQQVKSQPKFICSHCKAECQNSSILWNDLHFCCNGCKTVYEILEMNNMCQYYQISDESAIKVDEQDSAKFAHLDNPDIANKLVDFSNKNITRITFYLPTIHCSSCIWLLENLHKINPAILNSKVDFLKKQVFITFQSSEIKLSELATLCAKLGYEPLISLSDVIHSNNNTNSNNIVIRLAVAGFCSGNIMMFSFPEYFGIDSYSKDFSHLFTYLNLILSLPVFFYSGWPYFDSVHRSIIQKRINIDVPIFLGILVTFVRSVYEVASGTGVGYFDSLSGLIFFLLIGKWFQQKTFSYLSFERDYASYFPLSVTRIVQGIAESVLATNLKIGDKILIKNEELIPADALLYKGEGFIDYSFVTGESLPEAYKAGDIIYAGGRQKGGSIELEVVKEVSQSYLTQLWNNESFTKTKKNANLKLFTDQVGVYFTLAIVALAIIVGTYWYTHDPSKVLNACTAILIIACPCTLSLSYPISLGNVLRKFGKHKFYVKNIETIEKLAKIDAFVFDKTGTITDAGKTNVAFVGEPLLHFETTMISSLVQHSGHPLSNAIFKHLNGDTNAEVLNYKEYPGKGISGTIIGVEVKIGSAAFIGIIDSDPSKQKVHISINGSVRGYFVFHNVYKPQVIQLINQLAPSKRVFILSGDTESEKSQLEKYTNHKVNMWFNQSPQDKLDKIKSLQDKGLKVCMIGDGLNDAGALKQADIGISVTDHTTNFTPSSDIISMAEELPNLNKYLSYAKHALLAVQISFGVSLVYNTVGLTFAVQGNLQPIVAAILMPMSSISVVGIAMLITGLKKL
ncbi:MAG: heavy metal translocating P-type ATPase metal-binding domain-containing protein [Bacteroidota bacterium]|nr:heavy metal translocating P-type ATPase metal-binding domain-containing protein [Bacteroidota bacterium]